MTRKDNDCWKRNKKAVSYQELHKNNYSVTSMSARYSYFGANTFTFIVWLDPGMRKVVLCTDVERWMAVNDHPHVPGFWIYQKEWSRVICFPGLYCWHNHTQGSVWRHDVWSCSVWEPYISVISLVARWHTRKCHCTHSAKYLPFSDALHCLHTSRALGYWSWLMPDIFMYSHPLSYTMVRHT